MQKWEYKYAYRLTEIELNRLGEQGWELVAVTFTDSGSTQEFYLKRPKS